MHAPSSGSDQGKKPDDSFVDYTSASERQDTVWNPSTPNIVEKSTTVDNDSTADPIIGKALENYKVIKLIGRGGFGAVFLARDTKLKRDAAIKLLHQGKDQDFIRRFMQEAQVLANLSKHPNIVQIYDFGQVENVPFFSMEFVDGGNLKNRVADGPLDIEEAIRLTEIIARAIHLVHLEGFGPSALRGRGAGSMSTNTPSSRPSSIGTRSPFEVSTRILNAFVVVCASTSRRFMS